MPEKEIRIIQQAAIYELRLIFTSGEKKQYTTDSLFHLFSFRYSFKYKMA